MKYPKLILNCMCKVPIKVHIESEEITNLGEPEHVIDKECMCNFQDKAKTILTAEKKIVRVTGTAYISGDIAPELATISGGTVEVFGAVRRIEQGIKARNPDGTVNFTCLEVV